ncbi:MAG: hypothetical protein HDS38_08985 [Bacteroides sp.]|nr:hypothetical protein [Bacteroides sp.]
MLGTAIGCIGLSLEEFSQLYFEEFESVCRAWQEMYDAQERGAWERTRVLASICIQPHVRKKITPRQILPLPWDRGQHKTISHEPEMTREQQKERFEELKKRLVQSPPSES